MVTTYYSEEHEWIGVDGNTGTVGITDFAQGELGDIVYIEVDSIGENLESESVFGTVEAVKTVSDLFMPLSGEIIEFNSELESRPELVNEDPYNSGWMIKIKLSDLNSVSKLLDSKQYKDLVSN